MCFFPPINELIFDKAGFSVIWSLLKKLSSFCLARIVRSRLRLKQLVQIVSYKVLRMLVIHCKLIHAPKLHHMYFAPQGK